MAKENKWQWQRHWQEDFCIFKYKTRDILLKNCLKKKEVKIELFRFRQKFNSYLSSRPIIIVQKEAKALFAYYQATQIKVRPVTSVDWSGTKIFSFPLKAFWSHSASNPLHVLSFQLGELWGEWKKKTAMLISKAHSQLQVNASDSTYFTKEQITSKLTVLLLISTLRTPNK